MLLNTPTRRSTSGSAPTRLLRAPRPKRLRSLSQLKDLFDLRVPGQLERVSTRLDSLEKMMQDMKAEFLKQEGTLTEFLLEIRHSLSGAN